ncbi:DUF2459 domain-containing protein [Halobacteriovorax sp. ZH4_bin.1]|uniref:DUF2459 domain-containing protein n=1 Tax=unclassified Halobacteriovorax TaxID=2639665 RepID=UPI0037190031
MKIKTKWPFYLIVAPTLFVAIYFAMTVAGFYIGHQRDVKGEAIHRIYIVEGAIHTGILFPMELLSPQLRSFTIEEGSNFNYFEFGWGDREFFLNVPEMKDLTLPIFTASLFLPSSSVMHVTQYQELPKNAFKLFDVKVSQMQLNIILNYIEDSFKLEKSRPIKIQVKGYYNSPQVKDSFFEANGSYHMFNTCNMWTARGLFEAGIKTSIFTPFKYSVSRFINKD